MPITSLIGGLLTSSAAKTAAQQASSADTAAATGITGATKTGVSGITAATTGAQTSGQAGIDQANQAIASGVGGANQDIANAGTAEQNVYNSETGTIGAATGALSPYETAGTSALTSLSNLSGTFQAPTAAQAAATPGYQFQLDQGLKALNNSAATSGMLQSGANMKANQQYAQGLASTNYQNVYNNALSTFNANQAGLSNLANLGTTANSQNLQAAGLGVSAGSTYGSQLGNLASLGTNTELQGASLGTNAALQGNEYIGTSGLQGAEGAGTLGLQGSVAAATPTEMAGSALAAGTMGAANAWSSTLNSLGNMASAAIVP